METTPKVHTVCYGTALYTFLQLVQNPLDPFCSKIWNQNCLEDGCKCKVRNNTRRNLNMYLLTTFHTYLASNHDMSDFIFCPYRQHVVPRFTVAFPNKVTAILGFDIHQDLLCFFACDVTMKPSKMQ